MLSTAGGGTARLQQCGADKAADSIAPEQYAAVSKTGDATECLRKSHDGFGCAEMNPDLMLRPDIWTAEMLAHGIREGRYARMPDYLINFTVTKAVPGEENVNHRQQGECTGIGDACGTRPDVNGNVSGCGIQQVQATCCVAGSFNEQRARGVTVHHTRSAHSGKRWRPLLRCDDQYRVDVRLSDEQIGSKPQCSEWRHTMLLGDRKSKG